MTNKLKTFMTAALACSYCFPAAADDISANTARMQAMDKITGRVSEIDVPVNGLANFGTFSILVRKCVAKSPEETPENTAFVDVVDNYRSPSPVNIFKGWMFSSTPALNAVEHPIYDIWLLKCYNRPQERAKLLTTEQLALRDTIPMQRFEKKADLHTIELEPDDEVSVSETAKTTAPFQPEAVAVSIAADSDDVPDSVDDDKIVFEDDKPLQVETIPDLPQAETENDAVLPQSELSAEEQITLTPEAFTE